MMGTGFPLVFILLNSHYWNIQVQPWTCSVLKAHQRQISTVNLYQHVHSVTAQGSMLTFPPRYTWKIWRAHSLLTINYMLYLHLHVCVPSLCVQLLSEKLSTSLMNWHQLCLFTHTSFFWFACISQMEVRHCCCPLCRHNATTKSDVESKASKF